MIWNVSNSKNLLGLTLLSKEPYKPLCPQARLLEVVLWPGLDNISDQKYLPIHEKTFSCVALLHFSLYVMGFFIYIYMYIYIYIYIYIYV